MTFEVLDVAFVFFGGVECLKRPKILASLRFWVFFPRVKPVFTGLELTNHELNGLELIDLNQFELFIK